MDEDGHLERGQVLGRYVVLELLGRGGMGVVYAAYDPQLDRKIALKLLRTETAGEEGRQRMLREAQALAKLAHPNVVAVHDVGIFDERVFIAMEFIDGVTLTTWLKARRPPVREIIEVFRDAGRGLVAAHAAGLVHRDFKPDNVMIDRGGRARVLDFSLVYAAGAQPHPIAPDSPVMSPLTESGVVLGTPLYMPIEVLEGAPADARADQYAFCVTLYEALYGELPVVATTIESLKQELSRGKQRAPGVGLGVPNRVRQALARGLSTRPADRHASMQALLGELVGQAEGPPRRSVLAALVLLLLVVGGVVAYGLRSQRAMLCSGGGKRVAKVWGPEQRAAGERAFTAIGRPYAIGTWQRVDALMGDYAQEWQDAFRSTCEATRIRGEQSDLVMSLRMECLDRRLEELSALSELYAHADAVVVEKGVNAAISLRPVASCGEVAALAARVPPPDNDAQKKSVEALRARIARTEALVEAGGYAETRKLADAIVIDARQLGYRPLLGEALLLSGQIDFRASRYAPAEQALLEAVSAAEASRYDELAARIWPELVRLQGGEYVHLVAAHASEARALAALDRVGDEGVLRARLFDAMGLLRKEEGKHADSVEMHLQALAIAEKKVGAVHPLVGELCGHVANAMREAGRFDDALKMYARALEVQEKTRGADHPDLAEVLSGLGVTKSRQGDYAEALRLNQRALEIRERSLGPDHERVAVSLNNIAVVMRFQGNYAEGLPLLERSRRILAASTGAESPEVAAVYNNIGFSLDALARYDEAKANFERALRIRERALGEEHPIVALTLCNLGHVALMTHHADVALTDYQRALAIDDKAHASAENRAFDLVGVGRAHLELGHARDALPFLEEAYQLRKLAPALKLAESEQHLARALWDTGGDRARALALARAALERATAAGKAGEVPKAELATWLARHR